MIFAYQTLLSLLLPLILLRYWIKGAREPLYRTDLTHRLGQLPTCQKSIWIHAVSRGETQAVQPLVRQLSAAYPEHTILLTTVTATGRTLGQQLAANPNLANVISAYFPIDLPSFMRTAIRRTNPELVVVVETELWPSWLQALRRKKCPVVLINGRLSAKSAARYQRFPQSMKALVSTFSTIGVRDEADRARFIGIGAQTSQITVLGNIKFDQPIEKAQVEMGELWRTQFGTERLIWIAASTHEGEESLALETHREIRQKHSDALLILVPRHPNRFADVIQQAEEAFSEQTLYRSALNNDTSLDKTAVMIGDSMGEMIAYYATADIAVVGGSFVPVGGHNIIEPMALRKPTIVGSEMFNFQQIAAEALALEAIIQLPEQTTTHQLASAILELYADPTRVEKLGQQATAFLQKHQGAQQRAWQCITEQLTRSTTH